MALFDRFLARQVKTGELTLIHPDGTTKQFGTPDPAYNPVTIRLTAPGVAGAIVRHGSDPSRGLEPVVEARVGHRRGESVEVLRRVLNVIDVERG